MSLRRIQLTNLRNIAEADIELSSGFNVVIGANGSGKTSLLEAIHLLSLGRSFRTRLLNRVIQNDNDKAVLFGVIQDDTVIIPVGLEKQRGGDSRIRVANADAKSILEITKLLPVLVVEPGSHQLINSGPKLRRQFLDWGVFHVEHQFLPTWARLRRALQQRNASLRSGVNEQQVRLWDDEVIAASLALDAMRRDYMQAFQPLFDGLLMKLLPEISVSLLYKRGWKDDQSLETLMQESYQRDLRLGYTYAGAQRADLSLSVSKTPAQDVLSQGQQKLVVYAMKLAQGQLFRQQTGKSCLYLLDDLAAELDADKRHLVASVLSELKAQVIVTGVDEDALVGMLAEDDVRMFHVEHGAISQKCLSQA